MRINPRDLAFPLVVVAAVAYLGVGSLMLSGVIGPSPVMPSGSCGTAYPATSGSGVNPVPIPVLVLQPGSSGDICVTYTNGLGNNLSNQIVYTRAWVPQPQSASFTTVSPSAISVTPTPGKLSFDQGKTNESETVVFRVSVAYNVSRGVYGLFLYQFCSLFPFAVGNHLALTANEFSYWYPHSGSCPAQIMDAEVTGVDGFQLVYVFT